MTNEYNEPESLFVLQDVYDYLYENDANIGTNILTEYPDGYIDNSSKEIHLINDKKHFVITIKEVQA
jgi:hypothetical protein